MNKFRDKAVLIIALLLSSFSASAVDLPASLSGSYIGTGSLSGWQCELRAFAIPVPDAPPNLTTRVLSAECVTPQGFRAGAVSIWDACPSTETTQPPLADLAGTTPSTPRLSILSYSPSTAQCSLGQVVVSIGGGPATVFCRTQIVATVPYPGCNAPTVTAPLRVKGWR